MEQCAQCVYGKTQNSGADGRIGAAAIHKKQPENGKPLSGCFGFASGSLKTDRQFSGCFLFHPLARVFHQPLFFALPIGFFRRFAFVVLFLTFGQADFGFDETALVVQV